ncbi:Tripartite-type tricarboxylate transporter, receptor component TctC [Rhodospirillales bacterium URHD0017]|nr:Tripartite-type tricarboxylate transporter, receptor component TctC [Rhodospirillales bacterium URHD0017]
MTLTALPAVSRRLLLALPLAGLSGARAEEAWPRRTVRLVTLAAAGAGTDAVARTLAEALSKRWREPVIVDNRPGGDGIVSIETFLAARDDHVLLFNPTGVWTALHLLHDKLSFDPARDLVPLAPVVQDFIALGASPRLGPATLAEIVAMARQRPGALTWACAPSVPYLAFTAFLKATGLELTYVPYRNPIASLPDLAEGRVDLAFLPLLPMIGPAQAGKLRLVVVASADHAPRAPEVPTAGEAGFPGLAMSGGHNLFGPRDMPDPLRARIGADVAAILREPEVAQRLKEMGYVPRLDSPSEFTAFLERERAHWTKVALAYGAKPAQ